MTNGTTDTIRYYYGNIRRGLTYLSTINKVSPSPYAVNIQIMRECAMEKGLEVEEFVDGIYRCRSGNMTHFLGTPPDTGTAIWLCSNKFATFEHLRMNGFAHLPRYQRYSLRTIDQAREDFRTRNRPVVIKPSRLTFGGSGVTANIRNMRDLNKAIFLSLTLDSDYLMEDFIEGDNFRVLCYGDKMLDVIQRLPANVTGDGTSNIKRLIEMENEKRKEDQSAFRLNSIAVDEEVRRTLKSKGLSLDNVPSDGETVFVRTVCSHEAGDGIRNVTGRAHPEVIQDCLDIMRVMDVKLGGIDIITKDISRPLGEVGGVINEVNTHAGLNFHDKSVSMKLIDLMFDESNARRAST